MSREIHKTPELMNLIKIIQSFEEDKYSEVPTWDGWIENWTTEAVLLSLPGRRLSSENWFPAGQLRRTEDGRSLYASLWMLEKKGFLRMNCPTCDKEMEHIESEPDVNVVGGWECYDCRVFVPDWDAPEDEE